MTLRRGLLILIFCLPLVPVSRWFKLGGVSAVPPRVPLTWSTLWSGGYQEWFEANFARHFGMFAPLVKLDAAIDNAIGETRFNTGLCGLRGHHGVLFQHDEIDFNNTRTFDEANVDRRVAALARARDLLRPRGIALKVIFIPTKVSFFADAVPMRWRVPLEEPRPAQRITERTLRALERARIDVIDARTIARAVEAQTKASAFPREGRHFTDFTSCQILAQLDPRPQACPLGESRPARGAEDDLYRCFNEFGLTHAPERLVDTDVFEKPSFYRRPLFVGSSFMRELENEARRIFAFEDLHLFYYNQTDFVGERSRPLPEGDDWVGFVRSRDLIVIDYFAPQVERLGFDFPERVIREFTSAKDDPRD